MWVGRKEGRMKANAMGDEGNRREIRNLEEKGEKEGGIREREGRRE